MGRRTLQWVEISDMPYRWAWHIYSKVSIRYVFVLPAKQNAKWQPNKNRTELNSTERATTTIFMPQANMWFSLFLSSHRRWKKSEKRKMAFLFLKIIIFKNKCHNNKHVCCGGQTDNCNWKSWRLVDLWRLRSKFKGALNCLYFFWVNH